MGTWNAAWLLLPTGTSSPALGDDNIREIKVEVGGRLNQEHVILNTATTGASVHRSGSAVVYLQDAEPTLRPDGVTTFDANDHGRIWIDSNDSNHMYVYNGTDAEMQELTVGNIDNDGDLDVTGALTVGTTADIGGNVSIGTNATIATGGEASPDCVDGGVCLNQTTHTGNLITLKATGQVFHAMTDVTETDTFAMLSLYSAAGGLYIKALSESSEPVRIAGIWTIEDVATSTSGKGCVKLIATKKDGTGVTTNTANANIVTFHNAGTLGSMTGTTTHIFKGNGDIYLDGLTTAYDNENDIELARALQLGMAKKPTLEPYRERLEELKIMENGFVSSKGFMALSLGTLHQIWNGLKAVAERLNISEVELFELAKGEV
jgi:hypothetical protein